MFKRKSNRPADLPAEGRMERPDPTPIAKPVGFNRPPSIREQIQSALRAHLEAARSDQAETLEEADDFDVDDDPELKSPYEVDDELPRWDEKQQRAEALRKAEEQLLKTVPQGHSPPGERGSPAAPSAGAKDPPEGKKS